MDKYTVDLDQVLNDFEYSEFSVQQQSKNNIQELPQNLTFQAPPATKHSINNVFHSLNEYVNSSIDSKVEKTFLEKIDNKITDDKEETETCNTCGISKDSKIPNTDEHSAEIATIESVAEEQFFDEKNNSLETNYNEANTTTINNTLNCKTENLNNNTLHADEEENKNIQSTDEEMECDNIINNDDKVEESKENDEFEEEKAAICDNNEEILVNINEDVEETAIENFVVSPDNSFIAVVPEPMITEDVKSINTNIEKIEPELEESDNITQQVQEEEEEEPPKKIIGFSNDIEIDENELTQMLEDLLIEEGTVENLNEVEENVKASEKLYSSENTLEEPIECLEMEKPHIEATKFEENAVKESEEVEEKVIEEEETKIVEETVNRPNNLPLTQINEEIIASVGRKIDLIGSPGSTPYNNVYINKNIEPQNNLLNNEYVSSASPTYSDCSTESVSTASSTISIEDDKNKNKDDLKKNVDHETTIQEATTELSVEENPTYSTPAEEEENVSASTGKSWLGKEAPLWIPDADAASCLHCELKFTVIKRRHHCRACGLVLCSKCCSLKYYLEYLNSEARVCTKCYETLINKETANNATTTITESSRILRPNPNNPLEYCSTISPLEQSLGQEMGASPPSVMVPVVVGVLKRKGSNKKSNKSVMFCDGIAPGSDLTNLDQDFNYNNAINNRKTKKIKNTNEELVNNKKKINVQKIISRNQQPNIANDGTDGCFIPKNESNLPPTVAISKTDILYSDCSNTPSVVEMLKNEALIFALNKNLFIHVRIINMSCCINKYAWCFSTEGLINVGSDEIVYLIEYIDEECFVPKDVFFHLQNVYLDALNGIVVKELSISLHNTSNFLDSRNHAGFVYIKPTFQCLEHVIIPQEPYLIGILIHKWETPWAKLFPLRLVLRLGAEYRYYPSPLISTRHRDSVFVEIGHTIINLLADFRNFTYTLPQIRGLIIHMKDKKTIITIPSNRYDQIMKSINNSSEHILAFSGNFSSEADSHLVCIQDTEGHENCYTTHAINIHNKPREVTGASFIVFNGSLKSTSGLTAKSNIVEDGLMIQIPPERMEKIREDLRNMKNHTIACGCIDADSPDETVNILWGENDGGFNVGIKSPVDLTDMKGIPSIRVHNGKDYLKKNGGVRLIRWTEVFILQNVEENPRNPDPVDISKVSESISEACCNALVEYLDLLVSNNCQKIGVRVTLHVENVSYAAGSNGIKLTPIYMKSLDNELIPVLHRLTSNNLLGDSSVILELIFRILNI